MNAGEAQIPWSAPHIFSCLESNPEYRRDLLALASRLPDVASRTLLCPFFSYRSLNQFSFSPCLNILSLMCDHSVAQQKRYELEATSDATDNDKEDSGGVADEVTFAATLTQSLLEGSTVNLGETLLPVICNLKGRLLSVLWMRLREAKEHFSGDQFQGMRPIKTPRSITLVSQKKPPKTAPENNFSSLRHLFPMSLSSATKVTCSLTVVERSELLSKLGNLPVSFQVRSRDEVKQQLNLQKVLEASMTVVLPEQVRPLPTWKRPTRLLEEVTEAGSVDNSPTATPTTATPPPSLPPLKPEEEPLMNVTWVKEGELALVNGRIVHRQVKKPVQNEGKRRKKTWVSKIEDTKETTVTLESPANQEKEKQCTEHVREKKVFKEERGVSSPTANFGVGDTQFIPLMSRDEILAFVNNLQISDILRAALLIGLNGKKSENTKEDDT